jgi:glucan biosynthesis protein C
METIMTVDPSPASSRQWHLDWLRILAFGLLVAYHVGMYYVSWDWHIKSPHTSRALEPWMRMVSPWRMDLLFVISGAATAFMLRRNGADGSLLRDRASRLLWPLLFGALVIVPPQAYIEVVQRLAYAGSFVDFMRLYLGAYQGFCRPGGACLILPTWNHLWYLPYLFVYTALLWLALRRWPQLLERGAHAIARVLGGAWLLVVPVLLLAITRLMLRARFPATHALVDDWFLHSQYFAAFFFGAALACAPIVAARMEGLRWPALALAVAAWALAVSGALRAAPLAEVAGALVHGTQQWCAIVAALGFARRHLNVDNAARRWLTDAVFPVYILHQTVTIVLAHTLRDAQLPVGFEAVLLLAGTFALSFAGYELVRRIRVLRPVFGLRASARAGLPRHAGGMIRQAPRQEGAGALPCEQASIERRF